MNSLSQIRNLYTFHCACMDCQYIFLVQFHIVCRRFRLGRRRRSLGTDQYKPRRFGKVVGLSTWPPLVRNVFPPIHQGTSIHRIQRDLCTRLRSSRARFRSHPCRLHRFPQYNHRDRRTRICCPSPNTFRFQWGCMGRSSTRRFQLRIEDQQNLVDTCRRILRADRHMRLHSGMDC